jgi:CubicO group peptidase (beta-lactamase class C family)
MVNVQRICVLLLVLMLVPLAEANDTSDRVDKLFERWDKAASPGASMAVMQNGQIVYSRGYGSASLEYRVPNSAKTVFHIASLSKQFTAFAIQLLVQDGRLSLDDDIRKYIPELQIQSSIKVRQLLHHTSGLRDQWSLLTLAGLRLDDVITEDDILGLLFQQRELNFVPGEEELYSNSGYTLLALIVKRVTGQSFAEFAQARIFKPLGMADTHVQESYGTVVPGRAYSYWRTAEGYRYVALSYSNSGATSVFTTVEDLARWDHNFETAQVGGPAVLSAMRARERLNNGREMNYAGGLMLNRYRTLPTEEHGGSDAGYRTELLRFPEQHLTVVILANASDVNARTLAHGIADIYLEGTPTLGPIATRPTELEVPVSDTAPFLGDFQMRPGFLLSFTSEGHQLMVQATGQPRFSMFASADNAFFTKAFEASVVFDPPGDDGRTRTALWMQEGRQMPLVRVTRDQPAESDLSACAGDFYSGELRTLYTLSVRGGRLFLRYPRGQVALTPVTRDVFSAPFPLGSVALRRNSAGLCSGLSITTDRVRNLVFQKVKIEPAS